MKITLTENLKQKPDFKNLGFGKYNFDNAGAMPSGRHERYCRKSYEKYFINADEKIANAALSL